VGTRACVPPFTPEGGGTWGGTLSETKKKKMKK